LKSLILKPKSLFENCEKNLPQPIVNSAQFTLIAQVISLEIFATGLLRSTDSAQTGPPGVVTILGLARAVVAPNNNNNRLGGVTTLQDNNKTKAIEI
jgi:hypothetical protein